MIIINSGILANLVVLILLILIYSGWFPESVAKISSKNQVTFFMIVTLFGFFIELPLVNGWKINLGGFFVPLVWVLILLVYKKKNENRLFHLVSTIALLGASYFLLREIIRLDPVLLFIKELYQLTFFIVLITQLVVSNLKEKVALVIGGIILGELLFNLHHQTAFYQIVLGDRTTRDVLWLSLILIVFADFFLGKLKNWLRIKKDKLFKNKVSYVK